MSLKFLDVSWIKLVDGAEHDGKHEHWYVMVCQIWHLSKHCCEPENLPLFVWKRTHLDWLSPCHQERIKLCVQVSYSAMMCIVGSSIFNDACGQGCDSSIFFLKSDYSSIPIFDQSRKIIVGMPLYPKHSTLAALTRLFISASKLALFWSCMTHTFLLPNSVH